MNKCGARHCLFCADINDQSHFPAAIRGFAYRYFGKTGASTIMNSSIPYKMGSRSRFGVVNALDKFVF